MRRLFIVLLLSVAPSMGWAIDEPTARKIAEEAAGCGPKQPCQTRARFEKGNWLLVVWFVYGFRENKEPILKPGGWVGITVNQDGKVVEKVPGA